VVFDPTRPEQPALERAAAIARENAACLRVYACIYADLSRSADRAEETKWLIEAQREQLSSAVAPLQEEGIDVDTEVDWDKDWYRAVVRASTRHCADLVLKSTYRHSSRERFLNRTSDWTLIRECQCPVLLVREGEQRGLQRVLAAIDIQAEGDGYERLNRQIIDFSQRVLSAASAEVHFINAFKDLKSFPDRNTLIRNTGASSDRVHIQMGDPEKVIVERAHDLQAGLVVVGNSGRSGLSAVLSGNTVEKVLDKLECDVLSMP
jgi:universal stress protein E